CIINLYGKIDNDITHTDRSQKSAIVEETNNRQTDEEEQFRQDASAQKDGGNLGGEETTEADQGKQATQTQTPDTKNANREGTTSDTNGVGDAANVRRTRAAVLRTASNSVTDQSTAEELVDY